MSERVAALTLSHEVGHSFGAPHDSGECVGGGEAGHYLMHDTGSLGLKTNNMELSPCSRGNMTMVVSTRPQCWTVDTSAHGVCGNGEIQFEVFILNNLIVVYKELWRALKLATVVTQNSARTLAVSRLTTRWAGAAAAWWRGRSAPPARASAAAPSAAS